MNGTEMQVVSRCFVVDFYYVLIMYESNRLWLTKPNNLTLICSRQRTTQTFNWKTQKQKKKTLWPPLTPSIEKSEQNKNEISQIPEEKSAKYRFNAAI